MENPLESGPLTSSVSVRELSRSSRVAAGRPAVTRPRGPARAASPARQARKREEPTESPRFSHPSVRVCETGVSLPSIQRRPRTTPDLFQRGGQDMASSAERKHLHIAIPQRGGSEKEGSEEKQELADAIADGCFSAELRTESMQI